MDALEIERQALIGAINARTGKKYSVSVSKGKFQLQIVNYNRGTKSPVQVEAHSEWMVVAEFMEMLRKF